MPIIVTEKNPVTGEETHKVKPAVPVKLVILIGLIDLVLWGCDLVPSQPAVVMPPERVATQVKDMKPGEARFVTGDAFRVDSSSRELFINSEAPSYPQMGTAAAIRVEKSKGGVFVDMVGDKETFWSPLQKPEGVTEYPVIRLSNVSASVVEPEVEKKVSVEKSP